MPPAEVPYNPAHAALRVPASNSPKLTEALSKLAGPGPGNPTQPVTTKPATVAPVEPATEQPARFQMPDDDGPKTTTTTTKTSEKPAPAPVEPATPAEEHFKEPKQLREAYDRAKAELQAARAGGETTTRELEALRAEVAQSRDRLQALEPLEPKVKDYEQRLAEKEERLRISDFTQSEEFHGSFSKPLAEASESAERWIGQLNVKLDDDGGSRKATSDDFKALLRMDYGQAFAAAKEAFGGDFAGRVMDHYERVKDLLIKRDDAMKTAAVRSQEWLKQRSTQEAAGIQERRALFSRTEQALVQKHPELYRPAADDAEAQEVYQTGAKLAELAIDPDPSMTQEEIMTVIAKTKHRAAAFPLQVLKTNRLAKENAELKARLAAYEKSEPGSRSPTPTTDANWSKNLSDRLRSDLNKVANRRL
jgi:hypothetical protein